MFHRDSYGYRPGKSALDAVAACRKRCWKKDWIIDLDVERFFDSVRWDLIVKAVEANTDLPWVVLYVKRWLAAPLQLADGSLLERDRGTPQGSSVGPVLANLFMHYAFDTWLAREYPGVQFERYADDAVVYCATKRQAEHVRVAIGRRMEQVGLRLHPAKTRIVYCKDGQRRGSHEHVSFTFFGSDVDEDSTPEKAFVEAAGWGGPNIWFTKVAEAKSAKNRMHFDLRAPGGMATEVARLQNLGASVVHRCPGHTVMRDPEGNEFCVEPGPG